MGSVGKTYKKHKWCTETSFCTRCGQHQDYAHHYGTQCHTAENVTAISHLRALEIARPRTLEESLDEVILSLKKMQKDPIPTK